ncbi:anti-sigma factor domain-containing protein [Cryobacterium tagatosivorans]|uniref:Anti-sigma factor n=1 Tax=Cryobacterium tagatosivorans TaxID=1259199 RepID=A0A4R8UG63_9MICO|nr:anti-sigma factor [Cryobacterium tagatosivorans]TFB52299.1 anti-sigma factor [Cryobacterium tagatosivorans]
MTHIDRDSLALIALAEFDLTDPERQHLAECAECSLELSSLQHTVAVGRSAQGVKLAAPGDKVWAGIHAALGLSEAVAPTPRLVEHEPGAEAESEPETEAEADAEAERVEPAPIAHVGSGSGRRGRRNWIPVAVAAGIVGLIGGLGGGIWWESIRPEAPAPVIAEAQLDPFPGWEASGVAYVEEAADGHRDVVVDLADAGDDVPLREVWLIKADASGLISIGFLDGDTGTFTIPDGVNLSEYPLVDVSAEPDDGNPAHSGDSIVRGELRTL